ncbi:MAG: hypothetical protein ACREK4_00120 [Candidatus Rokuibacteriota bacterium]
MTVLNYLIEAHVKSADREIDGKMLNRPRLIISDGTALTYGADVDIGQLGMDPVTGQKVVQPLRSVPIAHGDNRLIYADAGQAVRLRRSKSGRWEIFGFSKRLPGTFTRYGVTLPDYCLQNPTYAVDPVIDESLSARALTYAELATVGGGYSIAPYGAVALFKAGVFIGLV